MNENKTLAVQWIKMTILNVIAKRRKPFLAVRTYSIESTSSSSLVDIKETD